MIEWHFRRKPFTLNAYVASREEDGLDILLADNVVGLYNGIVGIADKLKPGDVVTTPWGKWWVLSQRPVIAAGRS
jgi:hypothetical protein